MGMTPSKLTMLSTILRTESINVISCEKPTNIKMGISKGKLSALVRRNIKVVQN